jgi:hypothetical protein
MNHIWGPTPSDKDEKDSHPLIEYKWDGMGKTALDVLEK